jgi:hypothetical protein
MMLKSSNSDLYRCHQSKKSKKTYWIELEMNSDDTDPDYEHLDVVNTIISTFDKKFSGLMASLETAKDNMVRDLSPTSFASEYLETIDDTISEIRQIADELKEAAAQFWPKFSTYETSIIPLEEARRYHKLSEEAFGLEQRCFSLVDYIPVYIQLYLFQSESAEFTKSLGILQLLVREIAGILGETPDSILAFGSEFSFFPLISMKHSVISVPISAHKDLRRWIPLGHEVGHWLWQNQSFYIDFIDFVHDLGEELRQADLRWAEEFFSDMVMAELFSINAFTYFGRDVCFMSTTESSSTHPPNILRSGMMGIFLHKRLSDPDFPEIIGKQETAPTLLPSEVGPLWSNYELKCKLVDSWISKIDALGFTHEYETYLEVNSSIEKRLDLSQFSSRHLIAEASSLDDDSAAYVLEELVTRL